MMNLLCAWAFLRFEMNQCLCSISGVSMVCLFSLATPRQYGDMVCPFSEHAHNIILHL